MLKKNLSMLIIIITLIMSSIVVQAVSNIDTSNAKNGTINVSYKSPTNKVVAVSIEKGDQKRNHILSSTGNLPLEFGEGQYTVTVLENVSGKSYRMIETGKVNFKSENKNNIYLQSIEVINWNKDMKAIKMAKEITKNAKTDKEKVTAIHEYIVNNIAYDNHKAATVQSGYLPSLDLTLEDGQGIFYDYSALFAGMARSLNIPTKLVEGRKNDITVLHAWNQVYLSESNQWIIIDTTYDAALKKANKAITMIKDAKEYKVEREY